MDAELTDLPADGFEAVVIGAGPAGSVAAYQLTRAGVRTLLVDRSGFPRDKLCGGCLAPVGCARLVEIGMVDAAQVESWPKLEELSLVCGRGSLRLPIRPYRGVHRLAFDEQLASRAVEAGAVFAAGVRATVLEDDRVALERGGESAVLSPGVVVVADGLGGAALRDRTQLRWREETRGPVGFGAVMRQADHGLNAITMLADREGYVGLAPIGGGLVAMAAALSVDLVREHGPRGAVACIHERVGLRMPETEGSTWRGSARCTRRRVRCVHGRVLVVGDAARYVEPITGEGMSWAVECASGIAGFARGMLAGEDVARGWERYCTRLLRTRRMICGGVAWAARRPRLIEGLCWLHARTRLVDSIGVKACWGSP